MKLLIIPVVLFVGVECQVDLILNGGMGKRNFFNWYVPLAAAMVVTIASRSISDTLGYTDEESNYTQETKRRREHIPLHSFRPMDIQHILSLYGKDARINPTP